MPNALLTHLASDPHLIGHDEALREVTEAFASGRMHHAWLITGADGIGKATLAYHIANFILSRGQNPLGRADLQNRITKLVMAESHPDLLVIRRATDEKTGDQRKNIIVEDALKVASFLRKTSTHGGWRVVIVDEAHSLNRFGQNAILKILEEPPTQALILMTATTPGALLPTIRSRNRLLNLAPLDKAQMQSILSRAAPELSPEDLTRLIILSNGSIGFALKILETEVLGLYDNLIVLINETNLDILKLHALADQISRKTDSDSYDVLTALLINYLRERIVKEARDNKKPLGLSQKLQLWDKLRVTFATAEASNLDRKLAFIKVITELVQSS